MDKKPRSANFVGQEIELLCELALKHESIIDSKKSDAATWKEKEQEWLQIETEYNSRKVGVFRTAKTLKLKYEAIKKNTRKKMARMRAEFGTAGGPNSAPALTPKKDTVKEVILLTVEGLKKHVDSDVLPVEHLECSVTPNMALADDEETTGEGFTEQSFANELDSLVGEESCSLPYTSPPTPASLQNTWPCHGETTIRKRKYPEVTKGSGYVSRLGEIQEKKLEVLNLRKQIALQELRMKEEEQRQAALRYDCEERQRQREEKIKEMELEMTQIQLEKLKRNYE